MVEQSKELEILEQLIKTKWSIDTFLEFLKFTESMKNKLIVSTSEKGEPSGGNLKNLSYEYLHKKLLEHLETGNYIDVSNFAFLLQQKINYEVKRECSYFNIIDCQLKNCKLCIHNLPTINKNMRLN